MQPGDPRARRGPAAARAAAAHVHPQPMAAYAFAALLLLILAVHVSAEPSAAPPSAFGAPLSNATEGRYIVRFKKDAARLAAGRRLRASDGSDFGEATRVLVGRLRQRLLRAARRQLLSFLDSDLDVEHVYSRVFPGFVARMSPAAAALARSDPAVAAVEPDSVARLTGVTQLNPPAHLALLGNLAVASQWTYEATGCGVNVYLVDSGINFDLYPVEFGRRASVIFDNVHAAGDPLFKRDCNGHGTHSASLVGSMTYGVAKLATLRGVKVFGCLGTGAVSAMIAGTDFVLANATNARPAVALLPFSTAASDALDAAVTRLINANITVVTGAGNNMNADACRFSPGRLGQNSAVLTAGAIDASGGRIIIPESNVGPCVDILAPGKTLRGLHHTNASTFATFTGTSEAAAVVAGVAAMVLEENPTFAPDRVASRIIARGFGATVRDAKGCNNVLPKVPGLLFNSPNFSPSPQCRYCDPACRNGGFCEGGACNCPPGFQGATCETYSPFRLLEPVTGTGFFAGQNVTVRWDYVGPEARSLVTFSLTTIPVTNIQNPDPAVTVTIVQNLNMTRRSFVWTVPAGLNADFSISATSALPFAATSSFTPFTISTACAAPSVSVCERPVIVDTTANVPSAFPRVRYTRNGDAPGTVFRFRFPPGPPREITLSTCGPPGLISTSVIVHTPCHQFANSTILKDAPFGHSPECPVINPSFVQKFFRFTLDPNNFRGTQAESDVHRQFF